MYECLACMYVSVLHECDGHRVQHGCWISWNWSLRCMRITMWVLWTKSVSFGRAAGALNYWAISLDTPLKSLELLLLLSSGFLLLLSQAGACDWGLLFSETSCSILWSCILYLWIWLPFPTDRHLTDLKKSIVSNWDVNLMVTRSMVSQNRIVSYRPSHSFPYPFPKRFWSHPQMFISDLRLTF